jgi:tripartite-type tricarboxylate transporter receptor subunit TctC
MLRLAAVAVSLIVSWSAAKADPVRDFYKGKAVSIIVGYGAGGGYDLYARLVARHLSKHIPGEPQIIVQNMPGAGSLVAANYIYMTAPKDGTAIATFARSMPMMGVLGGNNNVQFDPRKYTWLGSPSSSQDEAYMLWVRKASPVKDLEDARRPGGPEILLGGTADGSTDVDIAMLVKQTVGINLRVIPGYPGSSGINLAIERGEVDGRFIGTSSVASTLPAWLKPDGPMRPLLQFARATRLPEFPDVPTAREAARDERGRQLIELAEIPYLLSRPYVAPPGIPPERAKALQQAFLDMAKDPEFLADAKRQNADVSPVGAAEALQMLDRLAAAPADLKEAIRKMQGGG